MFYLPASDPTWPTDRPHMPPRIQLADNRCVGVGNKDKDTSLCQLFSYSCDTLLICRAESLFGVMGKVRGAIERRIWWIQIDEIALFCILYGFRVVASPQLRS